MTNPFKRAHSRSLRVLELTNFFLADVQTGLGPYIAAYLAASGWAADRVGAALTLAGMVTVLLQTPAGAVVDRIAARRWIVVGGALLLGAGALLLAFRTSGAAVYTAQAIIGAANPFLAPTLAALTLGLTGPAAFDRQFGRNQSFNSAGNVVCAILIIVVSRAFGDRSIFLLAAALVVPTVAAVLLIRRDDIDEELARGREPEGKGGGSLRQLLRDRVLAAFLGCAFLFHLSNAAMLPQLGEMLAKSGPSESMMSACILVTQGVIAAGASWVGRMAGRGRKPLLLLGFGVLPLRGILYTVVHGTAALIAVQLLDGVANAIWVVVSILVVADRTRGTGHFNLAQGALVTSVGLGAALSTTVGGYLITTFSYRVSFLVLAGIAGVATAILQCCIPETATQGA